MSDESSFMITHLIDALRDVLPATESDQLDEYASQAAHAGSAKSAEWRRAIACARWSDRIVALPAHRHLRAEAAKSIEAVRLAETTAAFQLGQLVAAESRSGVSPEFAAELDWVYEAVHVAGKVAHEIGWPAVPWRQLLEEMLAVPNS